MSNYELNKRRFVNEVQSALDLGMEQYYADKAKNNVLIFASNSADTSMTVSWVDSLPTLLKKKKIDSMLGLSNTITANRVREISVFNGDKEITAAQKEERIDSALDKAINMAFTNLPGDSLIGDLLPVSSFQTLQKKVMISFTEDLLKLGRLWSHVQEELQRKGLDIDFQLTHTNAKGEMQSVGDRDKAWALSTNAKSTYLKKREQITINFENASLLILKRGLIDLIISLLLIGSVLGALIYLYQVISQQKQLSEIKNDLISNITHEFKTPIATISSAIEGISSFNEANDQEKTRRYLAISDGQLKKLNGMVEKLLETATIDSGSMDINKEDTNLNELTNRIYENFKLLNADKTIHLNFPNQEIWSEVDPFHLENAISNLVDNAIKYGGNKIDLILDSQNGKVIWKVIDNGGQIEKVHRDRIFEKLYRIPKGNQHDVKGFGIGLFYSKEVIEKHNGSITLTVKDGITCFMIKL
ncbi:MAG: HAMP domain-containing sensor histidine kinase [Bacteroidota bacterium]